MTRLAYALYTAGLTLALLGYLPAAIWRSRARGAGLHLNARLGRDGPAAMGGHPIWIHAVSVGETVTAAPIVRELLRRHPGTSIVLTTVTATGARVAAERLAGTVVHRYAPVDLPGPVRRTLAAFRPRCLVILETELWPNLLRLARASGVRVMVANGRISDRSYRRYRRVRWFMRAALAAVDVFGMRDEEDARRIISLGADPRRVIVTGNIKHEVPAGDVETSAWRRRLGLDPDAPVWVAGSTHRGEEALVIEAHVRARDRRPGLRLVLAPRHPERVEEVERLIMARGLPVVRRSAGPGAGHDGAVVVVDTVGELAQIYQAADVVFVGGSLVPAGGHNVIEPAASHKPVLFGPHTSNFQESAVLLREGGGGLVVSDADALGRALERLLTDSDLRSRMGDAAFAAVRARQGALERTLDALEGLLA
jgi:3-deoxy-D-manno-octulosonic-acid transferase